MKNLTTQEIQDLINRYQSELNKLQYQVERTKKTIEELEEEIREKDISSDLEAPTKPSKKRSKSTRKKSASKPKSKKGKSPGRPPKHVIHGRETETRHGHTLTAWDQMIFDTIEEHGKALKTKTIISGVKEEASSHNIDASDQYLRQKVSQSIHKLSNKYKILSKIDAEGRGYAYAPKEWVDSKGKLKSQYKIEQTKKSKSGTQKKASKKQSSKSKGRRGRPPKYKAPVEGEPETRGGYRLSPWDQMIFNVIEETGQALKTKDILDGARKWADKNNIDADSKYIRQKVASSIHKLSNKHKTLKKVDAEGRGYAYAPKEWTNPKGNLKKKYQPDYSSDSKKIKSESKKKQTTSKGRRGRPPKYKAPVEGEPKTRGGYRLSPWDQMIFNVIEDAGQALKTKDILDGARKWADKKDVDADSKYLRQKVAASIHKLSNKHKTLKKVDAEGRGYAYAPKEWTNSKGNLKKKYQSSEIKGTDTKTSPNSTGRSSGKGSRNNSGGYRLSEWDKRIIESIQGEGKALKNNEIFDHIQNWAKKESKISDDNAIKRKISQSLHKLANKRGKLHKIDTDGRGYAYAPEDWVNSSGNLKRQYTRK